MIYGMLVVKRPQTYFEYLMTAKIKTTWLRVARARPQWGRRRKAKRGAQT